jgi:hypothetical protein
MRLNCGVDWKAWWLVAHLASRTKLQQHYTTTRNAVGSVEAKFVNGTVLSWEHYGRILEPFKSGLYPSSLNFTGWTFHCQLGWETEDGGWFRFTRPPKLKELADLVTHGHFGVKSRLSSIARIDPFLYRRQRIQFSCYRGARRRTTVRAA